MWTYEPEELGINLSANEDSVFHEKCRELFVNRAKFIQPYKKRRIEEKYLYTCTHFKITRTCI